MSDYIKNIAKILTEDPDVFSKYEEKFEENTVLDEEVYGEIVGILKSVAKKNGLILDHTKLKVKFNPAGLTIKDIYLDCPDPRTKRDLAKRVAKITGDDNVKHTFNKNLRINLYNAINREFADKVREELNLEVTHQARDPENAENSSEVLPMSTFTQPAVTAEKPEEEFELREPSEPEPEGGPETSEPEPEMGMGNIGMGGMPPMGDIGGMEDMEASGGEEEAEELEEPEIGEFGLEPPGEEEEAEEAPPPEPEEEDEMISFENVSRVANILTEDPDIFIS